MAHECQSVDEESALSFGLANQLRNVTEMEIRPTWQQESPGRRQCRCHPTRRETER